MPGSPFVHRTGEEQRYIDINTFSDERLDGFHTFGGARNFNHEVRTGYLGPQSSRFIDGAVRIARGPETSDVTGRDLAWICTRQQGHRRHLVYRG